MCLSGTTLYKFTYFYLSMFFIGIIVTLCNGNHYHIDYHLHLPRDVLLSVFPVAKTFFAGLADDNASFFLLRSEKYQFRIFFTASAASQHRTTRCATSSAAISSICCVYPLPRDRPLTTGKVRCGYSLTVLHFRKSLYMQKVGSPRNGLPVI